MCGISGLVGPGADERRVAAMVAAQRHRGPDDEGIWGRPGIWLGHNRLSIFDLSAAGHQPMTDGSGLWIVFNGEIYNHPELRRSLGGHRFRSKTDTEVILVAYRRWGESCLEHFKGMFAFALWDESAAKLFCARDHFGIKPFHYSLRDGHFYFASEVKALLAAGIPAEPNYRTIADYLNFGLYDHDEETFLSGIRCLPPGHKLSLVDGRASIAPYWRLEDRVTRSTLDDAEASEALREAVADAVHLSLRSDVPIGVNLSGGLDSSVMLYEIEHAPGASGHVRSAFTSSYDDPRYDETAHVAALLEGNPLPLHNTVLLPAQVPTLLAECTRSQDAPVGGVSTLAYHALHGRVRDCGLKVSLEGQGMDEILGGYANYRDAHLRDLLEGNRMDAFRMEVEASGARPDATIARLRGGGSAPTYQDGTAFLKADCVRPQIATLAPAEPALPRPFGDRLRNAMFADLRFRKLPRVLRMNDRLSMAHGCELRPPFLDHTLVELCFSVPGEQRIRRGLGKFLLRNAYDGRLPQTTCWTDKRAVVAPQREWLRGPLREFASDVLASGAFRTRGIFDPHAVDKAWHGYLAGTGDNSFFVWQWLNLEIWFQELIDRAASRASTAYATSSRISHAVH